MTREERLFFQIVTTEVGTTIEFKHDSIIIGKGILEEPIEIAISSYDDFDLIKDLREPLKEKLFEIIMDGEISNNDEQILLTLNDRLL